MAQADIQCNMFNQQPLQQQYLGLAAMRPAIIGIMTMFSQRETTKFCKLAYPNYIVYAQNKYSILNSL